ncbi:MAG TPA: alkaline phosphatase D family protein, partial [Chitinophagales bacterium]|nr:alkaline phosphatase D family protein [Chitinophagales bacterium]
MRFHFVVLLLILLYAPLLRAQFITHGPAIGGLTPHSARMYLRTAWAQNFAVQLSQDSLFTQTRTYAAQTIAQNDTTAIVELNLLQPNKRYFYRVLFNGVSDAKQGSFRTFPPDGNKGNYVFATGSCQETPNMKVFDVITQHQPHLFLHTGDWTYPSYQLDNSYPANYETVKKAWRRHYEELQMKEMLLTVPIDYVPDDDDGFGPTRDFWWGIGFTQDPVTQEVYNFFTHDTITPIMRSNVMRGYTDFFPGYSQLPDTSIGLYHSFKMGNCEFFFLDTRSNADVPTQAYTYDAQTNRWAFNPPPGHKIIGDKQMQWLKNGLQNSTADWKFLVGGVPFNKNIRLLINFALNFQNI